MQRTSCAQIWAAAWRVRGSQGRLATGQLARTRTWRLGVFLVSLPVCWPASCAHQERRVGHPLRHRVESAPPFARCFEDFFADVVHFPAKLANLSAYRCSTTKSSKPQRCAALKFRLDQPAIRPMVVGVEGGVPETRPRKPPTTRNGEGSGYAQVEFRTNQLG